MTIIDAPSPNFDDRGRKIDMAILHYTGMRTGAEALERLCDAEAKVSAHYLVEEDGRIFRLVAEEDRAWHAGVSAWGGEEEINARSIGIEIVNPGHEWGYRDFPAVQIEAVIELLKGVVQRWAIPKARVLGHSDVAPMRKEDPGEKFPWEQLADNGLAIAPFAGAADPTIAYEDALSALHEIGYQIPAQGHGAARLAFQRRFCPDALGQGFSPLTKAALVAIAKEMKAAC